jgi:ABC-type branched-subunit amino acid transport system permease subunit
LDFFGKITRGFFTGVLDFGAAYFLASGAYLVSLLSSGPRAFSEKRRASVLSYDGDLSVLLSSPYSPRDGSSSAPAITRLDLGVTFLETTLSEEVAFFLAVGLGASFTAGFFG